MSAVVAPLSLILLPGLDGTGELFAPLLAALPAELSPIVVRYPADRYLDYEALEPLVRAAIPAGRWLILGESYSGPLAIRIAADPPPGLVGLILSTSFATSPRPLFSRAAPLVAKFRPTLIPRALRTRFALGRDAPVELATEMHRAVASVDPAVLAARAAETLTVDVTDALSGVRVPVLVLHARCDAIVPRTALLPITRHARRCAVVELDGPHMLLQTRPADCAAAILRAAQAWRIG